MPIFLGFAAFAFGASVAVTNAIIGIASIVGSTLVSIGVSVGLSYLAKSLIKKPSGADAGGISAAIAAPRPEDVQQSVRQSTAPRIKHYGRMKVSGPWVFAESLHGNFYKVLVIGVGPIDAIEEIWIDDTVVTVDGSGAVQTAPWVGNANIETRLGAASETYYTALADVFSEWTVNHRGDGVASLFAKQHAVGESEYLSTFPNGINTGYRLVIRGAKLTPFGGGTAAWDDNAAAVIYDYLRSSDGMRLPAGVLDTAEALTGWQTALARAGDAVTLAAGGSEERYRLWGSYRLDERPAEVLGRMLACCDGRLKPTSDGGLTLDIGEWAEPSVTIDSSMITGFSRVSRRRDILDAANTIRATYLDPDSDYQTADADPWADADDVSAFGEIADDIALPMCPSHTQARRLMKLAYYRANPGWSGTFECNLKALAAAGERFVRLRYPAFGIEEVMEVQDLRFNINSEDATLLGVTLTLQSMPSAAYQWDETQEEGEAPSVDGTTVDNSIPLPTNFNVVMADTVIGGDTLHYPRLSFDAPPSSALLTEARGKKLVDPDWTDIPVSAAASSADGSVLQNNARYEFQIRHATLGKREGDWTDSIEIDALTTAGAPAAASSISAAPGSSAGEADIAFTSPSSANYACQNIYRNSENDEGDASLVDRVFGEQSTAEEWTDAGLSAGTYYYWLKSRNTIGTESASVATGAVAVT